MTPPPDPSTPSQPDAAGRRAPAAAPAPSPEQIRRASLEKRLAETRAHLQSIDRDRRRIPWLLALAVLAIPAGALWGTVAALLVLGGTIALVAGGYYLTWGHRSEYQELIAKLQAQLRKS